MMDEKAGYFEINVRIININNYLVNNGIQEIDYRSVDTEGHELEILKTMNLVK